LRARKVSGTDLNFLDGDVRDTAATVGVDVLCRNTVDCRLRCLNLAGFRARNCRRS
jgi:hypothetical protein